MGKNDKKTKKAVVNEAELSEKRISEAREIIRSEERKLAEIPVPMEVDPAVQIDVSGDVNAFGPAIDGSESSDDEEMKQIRKAMRKMRLKEEYRMQMEKFASQTRSRPYSPVASSSHIPSHQVPRRASAFNDGFSIGSESVRSEKEVRLEKQVKELEKEKKKNKKCCSCSTASACSSNLCGCKNTRQEGCGKGCGCQTTSPNGCFNPYTKKDLRQKYKHVGRAGYLFKHYKHAEKRGPDDAVESDTGSSGSGSSDSD